MSDFQYLDSFTPKIEVKLGQFFKKSFFLNEHFKELWRCSWHLIALTIHRVQVISKKNFLMKVGDT